MHFTSANISLQVNVTLGSMFLSCAISRRILMINEHANVGLLHVILFKQVTTTELWFTDPCKMSPFNHIVIITRINTPQMLQHEIEKVRML